MLTLQLRGGRQVDPSDVQSKLNASGCGFKLVVDGKIGPKTREAIVCFQKKNRLEPNGLMDEPTLKKLG